VLYSYDKVGNLLRKTDFSTTTIGSIHYGDTLRTNGNAGPNAVKSVSLTNGGGTRKYEYDNNGNLIVDKLDNVEMRSIQYNAFNKPILISVEGGRKLNPFDESPTMASSAQFFYAADQMRFKQLRTTVNTSETTYYIGKLYEEVRSDNRVEKKLYIGDIAQQTEVTENGSTQYEIGYFHKDRLGSNIAISNETGTTFEGRSFDPFGKPRKDDLSNNANSILADTIYKRGFTDHEQLDDSQLIHMNGRAYDYNLGRFLSVDPFIQAPSNSQSMNPYSYIMNNPLAGTDPSGYLADLSGSCIGSLCDGYQDSDSGGLGGDCSLACVSVENGSDKEEKESKDNEELGAQNQNITVSQSNNLNITEQEIVDNPYGFINSITPSEGLKSDKEVKKRSSEILDRPPVSKQNIETNEQQRKYANRIKKRLATALIRYNSSRQHNKEPMVELFISVEENSEGEFVITRAGLVPQGGTFTIPSSTDFVVHFHHIELEREPGAGDFSPAYEAGIPNITISLKSNAKCCNLFEVGRHNSDFMQREINDDSSISKKGWHRSAKYDSHWNGWMSKGEIK